MLHGELSDELEGYPDLDLAIESVVLRASLNGMGLAIGADDPEHAVIAVRTLTNNQVSPLTPIKLTGAWYDPTDQSGCINSTMHALREAGFTDVEVMECAAAFSPWDTDDSSEKDECAVVREGPRSGCSA